MEIQMKEYRKSVRKEASHVGWGLSIYNIFLMLMIMLQFFIAGVTMVVQNPTAELNDAIFDQIVEQCEASGTFYLIGVSIGLLILLAFFRQSITITSIMQKNRKMSAVKFLCVLCIFMSVQFLFNIFGSLFESGLNLIGYSAMEDIESAASVSTTVSMFLYASFIGPIAEELVYRGFVLRSFQKYGKIVAIVISSILFAVMHENIPQGVFAFGVGIVLSYVTLEYSIYWAIALHVINNCIFSDVLGWLFNTAGISEPVQESISMAIFAIFAVAAACILWKKRQRVKEFINGNKTEKKVYVYILSAVGIFLFIAVEMFMALKGIQRL